jgi:purine-binding chemotaxis protein CheW
MTRRNPAAFCTFRLGDSLFGIDLPLVKEVSTVPPMTPVPQAPAAVRGYVNLRGLVTLVLDLRQFLGMEPAVPGPDTRLVLFKSTLGDPFGVLVDAVGDVVTLAGDRVEERPHENELVTGVGKLADDLLLILDARKLLPRVAGAIAEVPR